MCCLGIVVNQLILPLCLQPQAYWSPDPPRRGGPAGSRGGQSMGKSVIPHAPPFSYVCKDVTK